MAPHGRAPSLNDAEAVHARHLHDDGFSIRQIAERTGASRSALPRCQPSNLCLSSALAWVPIVPYPRLLVRVPK
ncbi:MAG: helix-turn-helix domain-containing protein [Hyphomicrobium sp.]